MLKKFFAFFVSLFIILTTFSEVNAMWGGFNGMSDIVNGNGNIVTNTIDLNVVPYLLKIKKVSFVSSPYAQIHTVLGDQPVISITTDENIIGLINTRIDDRSNIVEFSSAEKISPTTFLVEITTPLKGFDGRGEFDIKISSMNIPEFNLSVDGQSTGELNLDNINSTNIITNGQSKLKVAGTSNTFNINTDGEANINALELFTHQCKVSGNGCGKIDVFADNLLDLNLEGNWKCNYAGHPLRLKKSLFGLCKVREVF